MSGCSQAGHAGTWSAAEPAAPSGAVPSCQPQAIGQQVVMPLEQALFLMDQAKQLQQRQQHGGFQAAPTPSQPHSGLPQNPELQNSHMAFGNNSFGGSPHSSWQHVAAPSSDNQQQWGAPHEPFGDFGSGQSQFMQGSPASGRFGMSYNRGAYASAGPFSAEGSFEPPVQNQFNGGYGSMQQQPMHNSPPGMGSPQHGAMWPQGQEQWADATFSAGTAPLRGGRAGRGGGPFHPGRHLRGRRGR